MSPKTENIILGVAALGLAYALYKVFSKSAGVGTKTGTTAPSAPVDQGGIQWVNGVPVYVNYAPFNSNTLGGQMAIEDRIRETLAGNFQLGFY